MIVYKICIYIFVFISIKFFLNVIIINFFILNRGNSEVEKEWALLRAKTNYVNSLQKEMDRYGRWSTLTTQVTSLKAFLAKGDECLKKASEDVDEACLDFKAYWEVLQVKKDDHINVLKSFEEEVVMHDRDPRSLINML